MKLKIFIVFHSFSSISQSSHYSVLLNLGIFRFFLTRHLFWLKGQKKYKDKCEIWILHTEITLTGHFSENLRKKYPPFTAKIDLVSYTFLTNGGKNENENGKFNKDEFDFWIPYIKARLYCNFHENLRKKNWRNFKDIFDKLRQKWRWKWKNLEK